MDKMTSSLLLAALTLGIVPGIAAAQNPAPTAPASGADTAPPSVPPAPTEVKPGAVADAAPAPAVKPARRHLKLGVNYTVFAPTDGHTRDRFGGSWTSVGLGIGGVEQRGSHSLVAPEFDIVYQSKGDNRVLLVPLGVSYRTYSDTSGSAKPYAGFSAGALVVSLQSQQDNISSGTSTGAYASVFAGASFTDNFFVEARYRAANKVRSFDLSGLSLSTGVRF